jgi:hypothetical protein
MARMLTGLDPFRGGDPMSEPCRWCRSSGSPGPTAGSTSRSATPLLRAARGRGIEEGTASHQLLEGWLVTRPDPALHEAWEAYVAALLGSLVPAQRALLQTDIVRFARVVAEAAGGFLGLRKVSAEEEKALEEIERALSAPG